MSLDQNMQRLSKVVTVIGYIALANLTYKILRFLQFNLRSSGLPKYGKDHRVYLKNTSSKHHPWVLITGASDGLGLVLVEEFAARGFNVVIHGRNSQKLNGIKERIEAKYPISIRTLVLDAEKQPAAYDDTSYQAFERNVLDAIDDIPLTVLVNCIGVIGQWLALDDRSAASIDDFLHLNVRFLTQITRIALPVLKRNKPGLILNISSGAEYLPLPWSTLYAGAKAYGSSLFRSLKHELQFTDADIEVLSLRYGTFCTPSTGRTDADATWDVPTAKRAAQAGLDCIGCGEVGVVPYIGHQIGEILVGLLPENARDKVIALLMRQQKGRMDALLKKE